MPEVEKITPYGSGAAKEKEVEQMFDSIAPAYDFMNRAMTLGIDRLWRKNAVGMFAGTNPRDILDVATGTGDLAILLAEKFPLAKITGVDLSENMINIGRKKIAQLKLSDRVKLSTADCLKLPFPNDSFDLVTVAYGVRNFADIPAGYAEMKRVIRPGGHICVIELSTPTNSLVKPLYKLITSTLIPFVGKMISKDSNAYTYLPQSIAAAPQRNDMCQLLLNAGFSNPEFKALTFGVCCIYTATVR